MSFILNSGRFGAAADPGLTLLQSATLWLDASDPGSDLQKAQNKGTGGTALDARLGSTTSVDTNDPLLLGHTGTNYLYLPGVSGNSASAPDSAALDITGDIEMVFRCAPTSWTVTQTLGGKWNSPSQKSYILYTEASTGKLWFWLSTDGTTGAGVLSSTAVGFSAGQAGWVKVTYRTSDRRVQFFTAADQTAEPSSWTQLGTDVTHSLSSIFSGTGSMWVGADTGTTNMFAGSFFRAIIRSSIGGTTVFDADFTTNTNQSSFTESSSNAATVTINRATSGRKSVMVTRPVWLFGTDDYMEIADNALLDFALADSFTMVGVVRHWGTPSDLMVIMGKRSVGATSGWALGVDTSQRVAAGAYDGANFPQATLARAAGEMAVYGGTRNVGADQITAFYKNAFGTPITDTTTGSSANSNPVRIGSASSAVSYTLEGEVVAVALFRSVLTSTELGQIATYYGV